MTERVDFWGLPHEWRPDLIAYITMAIASAVLLYRLYRAVSLWWRVGRAQARWDHLHVRIARVVRYALVQTRVLSQRYAGLMHVALAWAFFVFFLGTALATVDSHFFKFLQGNVYMVYKAVLDGFTAIFLVGAAMAAYRRFVQRPPRLTLQPRFALSLGLVTAIVAGGLLTESLRIAVDRPDWAIWTPAGWLVAQAWLATGASAATLEAWHSGIWLAHLGTVALLFVTLPATSLLHVLTGPLNIFFSSMDNFPSRLRPQVVGGGGEPVYTQTLGDLTWKQLLDGDACTECGRCQDVCPAYASGAALSPKQLVLSVRDHLRLNGGGAATPLLGDGLTPEHVWGCTTCQACMRECPVLVEHLGLVTDLRRGLVADGNVDNQLQQALTNLGRYGNSFGQSDRARARWAQTLQPKLKDARKEHVDYLWFVGDYASYNGTLADATRATADVFQRAGLNFGILYEAERNSGNDVRRVGEEGLYEILAEKNLAALGKASFGSIVTTDPHTYNTLKNEYAWPDNGNGRPRVLHYTELLDELVAAGKLRFGTKLDRGVTYHDACFLGRYNGIYDAPRRVLAATGCRVVEMPRNRDKALCCGAGGGRIWMQETDVKERPSEMRVREAAALDGVSVLVAACPKDVTMYRDAVKTAGLEGRLEVKDLIELVQEAM